MKNVLCVALGAIVGAGASALVGAKVIVKSIEKKKTITDKLASDEIIDAKLDEIKDPEELKAYVLKLKKALLSDDEDEMEKILSDLIHFKPSKQEESDEADELSLDLDDAIKNIMTSIDELNMILSNVSDDIDRQYESIDDRINIILSMIPDDEEMYEDGSNEDSDCSGSENDEWKEIEVETSYETSHEASEETDKTPDPEPKSEADNEPVTHESVLNKMGDTVINPLCSKYGEELRQPLMVAVCKLVDCGDDNVVNAYLKKFTSAVRSSRGSKKQIQKYIAEIEKLPIPEPAAETSAD